MLRRDQVLGSDRKDLQRANAPAPLNEPQIQQVKKRASKHADAVYSVYDEVVAFQAK